MNKIKVGIIGGAGYTGAELLRLLAHHPHAEVVSITSRHEAGRAVDHLFPSLRNVSALVFTEPDPVHLSKCDVVFCATPNGVAMQQAPSLIRDGVRVIDLSADFRLRDVAVWEQWYGQPHRAPTLVEQAVYGLPEFNRAEIKQAVLVANPGCYPTAVLLGYLPLVEVGLVDPDSLIADAKSGVSGAGRNALLTTSFCEASESFKAYAVSGHRHLPEIMQGLQTLSREPVELLFTPHLLPMIRGIHATLYARLNAAGRGLSDEDLQAVYRVRFADEPFVDVMDFGSHPDTRSVRGGNLCRLAVHRPQGGTRVVVLSVEDNLVKGAAGQAIQNMNLMFGFEEASGLTCPPMVP